jgi:hypothetical protein
MSICWKLYVSQVCIWEDPLTLIKETWHDNNIQNNNNNGITS